MLIMPKNGIKTSLGMGRNMKNAPKSKKTMIYPMIGPIVPAFEKSLARVM